MMKKSGFTLIELMIVITIIGLLAAIAMPNFTDITKDAQIAQIQGNEKNIQTALNMYIADTGKSVGNLFGKGTDDDAIIGSTDEFTPEMERIIDKNFAPFFNYYSKTKLPHLPGSKRWRPVYMKESSLHHADDPIFDSSTFIEDEHHYGWIFTDKGNVYPVVPESQYGIRYDEFI